MRRLTRFLALQFGRPSGWAGRYLIAPWLDRISRGMNALALSELRPTGQEAVLEIGFGGGALLAAIAAQTEGDVIGIDISEAAVARVRRRFRGFPQVRVALASAQALPLEDGSVDAAVSVNSLYFWPDATGALNELARVVRPGGRLVLCFEPPEELRKWPGHVHGFRMLEVEEVQRLMEQAGFEPVSMAWGEGRKPDRFCCLSGTLLGANG